MTLSAIPLNPTSLFTGIVATVGGAAVMLAWRVRETQRPVSLPLIIIPPIGMATGFGMFFYPPFRIPVLWVVGALLFGAIVLAEPLVRTSRLERRADGGIVLKRSKAFLWILLGLLATRFALRDYIGHLVSPLQTAAVLFCLAFGMIARWRAGMYIEYQALQQHGKDLPPS